MFLWCMTSPLIRGMYNFMALFNDFLDFSTLAFEIAPLYTALGKMSDHIIHISGNKFEYAFTSFWIIWIKFFKGEDAKSFPPRRIISHRGCLFAFAICSHAALSWLHTMPRLPSQYVVVAVSRLHLACTPLALRSAQYTMEEPTMDRSLLTEKYEKMGGREFFVHFAYNKKKIV
jgi:hypothetical protein